MSRPTLPRWGAGRETRVIIDRPELQARRQRVVYSTLTLVAWVIWMYLWLPVVTLLAWFLGVRVFIREMIIPDPRTVLTIAVGYLLVVLVMGIVLTIWSQYNLRRFGGLDRRQAPASLSDQEMARAFGLDMETLRRLRSVRNARVEHDDAGDLVAVTDGEAVEEVQRQAKAG